MNYLNTNSGLKKDNIFKFSLPVKSTCIGAGKCLAFCYGDKGFYKIFKKTIDATHAKNFELSKTKYFVQAIDGEIIRRKIKVVRIHDTGDFYSQTYLDKWCAIALLNPEVKFYAYTKSLQLDFKEFTRLTNTKIIQSFGGKYDSLIKLGISHAKVFDSKELLWAANYVDCSVSDLKALKTKRLKIGLIKH